MAPWYIKISPLCFCSHLFLRSVDIAARDFLEQNGLADLIQLVVVENKVQFYGYNCFSFYDRFKRSIRLSLLKRTVQGQLEFKNPSLHVANLMHALQTH